MYLIWKSIWVWRVVFVCDPKMCIWT